MIFRKPNRQASTKKTLNKGLLAYKEIISIWKDTLDVAWKIAPIFLIPPGLFIWTYLKSINWTSIFYESAITGSGLIFLSLAALIMAFSIALMFAIPPLILISTTQIYESNKNIPLKILSQYRGAWLGWIIGSVPLIFFHFGPPWLIFAPPIFLSVTNGLLKYFRAKTNLLTFKEKIINIRQILLTSILASFSMSTQIFPMWICLTIFSQVKNLDDFHEYLFITASIVLSSVGIIPGLIYLNLRTKHTDAVKTIKLPLVVALIIVCSALCTMAIMAPISSIVLRTTGIYDHEKKTFQILKPNVDNVLSIAGLKVDKNNEISTATAYVRFHFVGLRLLCNKDFTPEEYLLLSEKKGNRVKEGGDHCVPIKNDEIREFRP